MIERLVIQNFQPHKKEVIDLDPYVTCLVGPTDAGKSAILRALRWLCLNTPSGDKFIRWGSEFVKVKATVDGHTITRKKGKRNLYSLDGKQYKAFGSRVPPAIANILNVDEVNFQRQHDKHFWIADTPGQVSRNLNQIVNLEAIDETLSVIASDIRKAKADVELTEERLAEAKQKKKELAWVREAARKLEELEAKSNEIAEKAASLDQLMFLISQVKQYQRQLRIAGAAKSKGQEMVILAKTARDGHEKAEKLHQLLEDISELEAQQCKVRVTRRKWDSALAAIKSCPICGNPVGMAQSATPKRS